MANAEIELEKQEQQQLLVNQEYLPGNYSAETASVSDDEPCGSMIAGERSETEMSTTTCSGSDTKTVLLRTSSVAVGTNTRRTVPTLSASNEQTKRVFADDITVVNNMFSHWHTCERTVVIYALLKRMPYANLKFLQACIESNVAQNVEAHSSDLKAVMLDVNANNVKFLNDFVKRYAEAAPTMKAELLAEILAMLPLLKPGNEEAKKCFMTMVPLTVRDAELQNVSLEHVQQMMSYLLIHPALQSTDRSPLLCYMPRLERCNAAQQQAFLQSSATVDSEPPLSWQTIAPPNKRQQLQQQQTAAVTPPSYGLFSDNGYWSISTGGSATSSCDSGSNKFCDNSSSSPGELGATNTNAKATDNSHLAGITEYTTALFESCKLKANSSNNNSDSDDSAQAKPAETHKLLESNSGSYAEALEAANDTDHDSIGSLNGTGSFKFLKPNSFPAPLNMTNGKFAPLNMNASKYAPSVLKTRRSNSLTTAATPTPNGLYAQYNSENINTSTSIENLAMFANKPRSFSLSTALQQQQQQQSAPAITVSASETHLPELKSAAAKFQTRSVGMACIGQWLKLLRLHKYIELLQGLCYEEFLKVNEDSLRAIGVTKGAAHKLATCIENLSKRKECLIKMQSDLDNGQIEVSHAIQELSAMAVAPMKPIEVVREEDGEENVGKYFLETLIKVVGIFEKDIYLSRNEDMISYLLWLLDRSMHHEAFSNHIAELKALKNNFAEMRAALSQNDQANKTNANLMQAKLRQDKTRWIQKCGGRKVMELKPQQNYRNTQDGVNFPYAPYGTQLALPNHNVNHQYKSSSYPNFMSNQQHPHAPMQANYLHPHQAQQQQHQSYTTPYQKRFNRPNQSYAHGGMLPPPQHPHQQHQQQQQQQQSRMNCGVTQHPQSLTNLYFSTHSVDQYTALTTSTTTTHDYVAGTDPANTELARDDNNVLTEDYASVLKVGNGNHQTKTAGVLTTQNHLLMRNKRNNNNSNINNNCNKINSGGLFKNNPMRGQHLSLLAAAAAEVGNNLYSSSSSNNVDCDAFNSSSVNCCFNVNSSNKRGANESKGGNVIVMEPINTPSSDYRDMEQWETLCRSVTEQVIN